ncbi:MAG: Rv3235 family protein [Jatrophihabitantaceae bacterium]
MTATIARPIRPARLQRTPGVRPAPRREPPFDDELQPAQLRAVGPLDRRLPFDERRTTSRLRPPPGPALPQNLPDPAGWGRRLLVGIIETAAGRRPLQQLGALLSHGVAAGLGADFERAARLNNPHWIYAATIRTVHASVPAEGVAELNATVQVGRRVRAIALRLEAQDGRWRCTRLQLG